MKKPFFVVNPKSYLYGEKLEKLAKKSDEVSEKYNVKIYFTAPFVELKKINEISKNIILTAQHMDDTIVGRGMGHIVGEMLVDSGVRAVILNHAEHKIDNKKLESTILRAKELKLDTIVCASTYDEIEYILVKYVVIGVMSLLPIYSAEFFWKKIVQEKEKNK